MMRRILVAVDGSPEGQVAQELAIDVAQRSSAVLTGIGVVDRPWIEAPEAVPLGAGSFKVHRDEVRLRQIREILDSVLEAFRRACDEANVSYQLVEAEGIPAETIEAEAEAHDVIVTGRCTNFHFDAEHDAAKMVARLVRDNPRPIIVTPARMRANNGVVVCYDGSLQASRAMHMFLLLGLTFGREIHLLSVARHKEQAEQKVWAAARLFEAHELKVHPHAIGTHGKPADILLAEVDALEPGLVVMGAYGHTGWRERLLGSATQSLLHLSDTPLFIHH